MNKFNIGTFTKLYRKACSLAPNILKYIKELYKKFQVEYKLSSA